MVVQTPPGGNPPFDDDSANTDSPRLAAINQGARMRSELRGVRQQLGWSQEFLARRLGVSRLTVVNVEQGVHVPNVLLALRISATVGRSVEYLFGPAT
jgi:putative transcriptional regulator